MAGRKCTVCHHANRDEIESDIRQGVSLRRIAEHYSDTTPSSVLRHTRTCLQLDIATYQEQKRKLHAIDYHASLARQYDYVSRLMDASEEWLTVEGQINLNPRSFEIDVVYMDHNDTTPTGEPKRKTKSLDMWIEDIEKKGNASVISVNNSVTDIRKLTIDYVKECRGTLNEFAKAQGIHTQDRENPFNIELKAAQVAQVAISILAETKGMKPEDAIQMIQDRYIENEVKQLAA